MIRKLQHKSFIQTLNPFLFRSYYKSNVKKPTLYTILSPLGDPTSSLVPELDSWVKNGNKVRVAELQRIIRDFRKRKRFNQALEVSQWMNETGVCIFSTVEHAVHLDLIGRVHGFAMAEEYFEKLREKDKNEKTYGALLNCYVRQLQKDKSISHLMKMKQLGIATSALPYNNIMCLYTNLGEHERVPTLLDDMKESNVAPDNSSYRICINAYGARSDIEGMETVLKEMEDCPGIIVDWNTFTIAANFYIKAGLSDKAIQALQNAEKRVETKDGIGYNHLITLYAALGYTEEVIRVWKVQKSSCSRQINRDYIAMLESLVKLGTLREAEEVLREWEASGNCYDVRIPNIVVIGYCEKELYDEAGALLECLMNIGKATTPNSWATVAAGFLGRGEMAKAVHCMKMATSVYKEGKGWKPNPRVVTSILKWLHDEGKEDDRKSMVAVFKTISPAQVHDYAAIACP